MKIIELRAQNIKKIKAIEIRPTSNTVLITGKNGQGKSSVLDSILYALGGKGTIPAMPIREGEDKAEITLDLGEFTVKRTFTKEGGGTLTVKQGEFNSGSPQKLIDTLVGKLSFDPLEFIQLKPVEQKQLLSEVSGVDTSGIDEEQRVVYEERTIINRYLKEAEEKLKGRDPFNPQLSKEEGQMADIISRLNIAKQKDLEKIEQERSLNETRACYSKLQLQIEVLQKKLAECEKTGKEQEAILATMETPDIPAIELEMTNLQADNLKIVANNLTCDLETQRKLQETNSQAKTKRLGEIIKEKGVMIANAKMPIEGLSFGEHGVTYGGLPFEQINDAEKLKVSMAMAMALNPGLRVIRATNASLLDNDNLAVIEQMAKDNDYQIWLEKVDNTGNVGIVIEDGEIKQAKEKV